MKARTLEQVEVEHRLLDAGLDEAEDEQHEQAAADLGDHLGARPAHRVVAVGLDAVGDPDHDRDQADGEGDVAPPVDLGRLALGQVAQLGKAPDRARTGRTGTETRNTARQATGARTPPSTRPIEEPATAATPLMPSARPRWLAGKASVMIALELANSIAPPTPCRARMMISHIAPALPFIQVIDSMMLKNGEDREAEVVGLGAAVDVAEPTEADDEHRGHDEEAEDQPQQVVRVARLQRVDVDALEDVRQRDRAGSTR